MIQLAISSEQTAARSFRFYNFKDVCSQTSSTIGTVDPRPCPGFTFSNTGLEHFHERNTTAGALTQSEGNGQIRLTPQVHNIKQEEQAAFAIIRGCANGGGLIVVLLGGEKQNRKKHECRKQR